MAEFILGIFVLVMSGVVITIATLMWKFVHAMIEDMKDD